MDLPLFENDITGSEPAFGIANILQIVKPTKFIRLVFGSNKASYPPRGKKPLKTSLNPVNFYNL